MFESLVSLGVDVEYDRWWDPNQKCNLLHLFTLSPLMIRMAREAGVKVVLTQIVDILTNLPESQRLSRRVLGYGIRNLFPESVLRRFSWSALSQVDAIVYMHKFDAETAIAIYGVPREKTRIIPHGCGVDQISRLQGGPINAHSHLISVASIVPRKNSVLLARAARLANVPVVFLGKPFSEENLYYQEFRKLVDEKCVIYPGYVSEETKNRLLTEASGFVLLSEAESGCISVYEAAAAGLPLLLSNLPWAYAYGKQTAIQHVDLDNEALIAERLSSFFAGSKRKVGMTFPVKTWEEIAKQYVEVYTQVLNHSER
jgi:glycosyltransferase involved in cell wall biosynthesis